jgi:hypothetical protein
MTNKHALPIEHGCDRCDGTGWEPVCDEWGVSRLRRCSCWKEAQPKAPPGVPLDFQDASLVNYEETSANHHALKAARRWVADPRGDIYLSGGVGVGKTRLAASMLNDRFRSQGGGYFARVPWLLKKLQPSNGEHDELARCCATSVLVLDDVGAERSQPVTSRRTLLMLYGDVAIWVDDIWTSNKASLSWATTCRTALGSGSWVAPP